MLRKWLSKYVVEDSGCRSMLWRVVEREDSGALGKRDYASVCIELRKGIMPELEWTKHSYLAAPNARGSDFGMTALIEM